MLGAQLKINLNSENHRSLDKLWNDIKSQHGVEISNKKPKIRNKLAVNELLGMILNDVKKTGLGAKSMRIYQGAINTIVQRKKENVPYLSERANEYLINAMKQEFSPHDSHDPLT